MASRLPGSARTTIHSAGSSSPITSRATCRRRRATRCRSTAPPTDFVTMKPTRGAAPAGIPLLQACTTRSGCGARTPHFTVWLKSADRVIRYRAGSTGRRPVNQAVSERRPLRRRPVTMARPARVRIRSRKPWTLARRRLFGWKVRLPLATTVSPRHFWQPRSRRTLHARSPGPPLLKLSRTGAVPKARSLPCRRRLGDCSRVLRSLAQVKPHRSGQPAPLSPRASPPVGTRRETC